MYFGGLFLNYPMRPAKAYPYEVINDPGTLVVSLDEIKTQLNIDLLDTSQDTYLTLLAKAATKIAEEYTRRSFINKTFRTYRNSFCDGYFVLRRSKLQSIDTFTYLKSGVATAVPVDSYYFTKSNDYSALQLVDGKSWPTGIDNRFDAITIDFIAGYGDTAAAVPDDLKLALLNHIAALYENRGDCDCDGSNSGGKAASSLIPATSRLVYEDYKIKDICGDVYY